MKSDVVSWYFPKIPALVWFDLETGKQGELGKNVFLTSRARRTSCNDLEKKKPPPRTMLVSTFLRYTLMLLIRLYVVWYTCLAQYYCGGVVSLCGRNLIFKKVLKASLADALSQYQMVTRSGGYLVSTLFLSSPFNFLLQECGPEFISLG